MLCKTQCREIYLKQQTNGMHPEELKTAALHALDCLDSEPMFTLDGDLVQGYRFVSRLLGLGQCGTAVRAWDIERHAGKKRPRPGGVREAHLKLDEHEGAHVLDLLESMPTLTLSEIRDALADECNVSVSTSALSAFLLRQPKPWRRKKLTFLSESTKLGDVVAHLERLEHPHGVAFFEDEFAFYVGQGRTTGRAPAGKRPKKKGKPDLSQKVNVIVTVGTDGSAYIDHRWRTPQRKGVDSTMVLQHVKRVVQEVGSDKELSFVMDKATIHTAKVVSRDALWSHQDPVRRCLWTPTSFPQSNPAEFANNYMKARMRRAESRTKADVEKALQDATNGIDQSKVDGWLSTAISHCREFIEDH